MTYHVYIMASFKRVLYTGVTRNLERRVFEHKQRKTEGFSEHYKTQFLVHAEPFGDIRAAIAREKQIKGWLRTKKVALIESSNPAWRDLSADWFPCASRKAVIPPPSTAMGKNLTRSDGVIRPDFKGVIRLDVKGVISPDVKGVIRPGVEGVIRPGVEGVILSEAKNLASHSTSSPPSAKNAGAKPNQQDSSPLKPALRMTPPRPRPGG